MTHPYLSCLFSQSALLDLYIKSVLMSKSKPPQHILDKSASLLRHVTHSEFKELLLPSMQKTMLRSPENAMRSEMETATAAVTSHTGGPELTGLCALSLSLVLSLQLCPACYRPSLWTSASMPWTLGRPSQVGLSKDLLEA